MLVCQSCWTLCNPMDCSPPGSSVHGILQARVLEGVAFPFPEAGPPGGPWAQCFLTVEVVVQGWGRRVVPVILVLIILRNDHCHYYCHIVILNDGEEHNKINDNEELNKSKWSCSAFVFATGQNGTPCIVSSLHPNFSSTLTALFSSLACPHVPTRLFSQGSPTLADWHRPGYLGTILPTSLQTSLQVSLPRSHWFIPVPAGHSGLHL